MAVDWQHFLTPTPSTDDQPPVAASVFKVAAMEGSLSLIVAARL
jgi:hypothetical protein